MQGKIKIEIDVENDSFQSGIFYPELEKILENLLNTVRVSGVPVFHDMKIYDTNGNPVGIFKYDVDRSLK